MKVKTIIMIGLIFCLAYCKGQNNGNNKKQTNRSISIVDKMNAQYNKNGVWTIYQDKKGNYWYGSNGNGLYFYNGISLTQYFIGSGLCSNQIREINEDKYGNIIISTDECISKFDGKKFITLTPIKSNEWKLNKGDIWLRAGSADNPGPLRYDGKQLHQLEFPKSPNEDEFYNKYPNHNKKSYSPYDIYTIYKDKKGHIWFGTGNLGLCRYDGKTISWMYEELFTYTPEGGSFGIRSIYEDTKGKYWICNTKNRFKMDSGNTMRMGYAYLNYKKENGIDFSILKKDKIYFQSIIEDKNSELWMTTYSDGVYRYNGKEIKHYIIKVGEKAVNILCIFKDKNDVLWLGTEQNWVYRFNGEEFERYKIN